MPFETRLFAKTSLVFLLATFVLGAFILIAINAGVNVPPFVAIEHAHLAGVGFVVNIVIGIALWMLPLDRERYPATRGRYPRTAPLWCWALVNGGLIVRVLGESARQLSNSSPFALATVLDAAAVAQVAGIALFAGIAWTRIRPPALNTAGTRA